MYKSRELIGIRRQNSTFVPFDDERIVCQMPESVSINYHWHVERLTAVDHDGDAGKHGLVSAQTGSDDYSMKSRQPLVYLLKHVFCVQNRMNDELW